MPKNLKQIQKPIQEELTLFNKKFRDSMQSSVPLLDRIMYYIYRRKGKQLRPLFVFLSAKLLGDINESTYRAASLVELLHTATLVHDDVVDDANKRRGFFSINALWKNKIAVLVGDYLLSKGLLLALQNDEFSLLKLVSKAVEQMSEGELLQIEKARKLDIEEEIYYNIIEKKTASLIKAACGIGAASCTDDKEQIGKLEKFGELIGMAFQIKDDLFDYGKRNIGKPVGIDIQEKKMTLPLIYALSKTSKRNKNRIVNIIKRHSHKKSKVKEVIEFVKESGGIEYATEKMQAYKKSAYEILEDFPDSEVKGALIALCDFVVEREK